MYIKVSAIFLNFELLYFHFHIACRQTCPHMESYFGGKMYYSQN